jgi:predicted glutamine amidotransferase
MCLIILKKPGQNFDLEQFKIAVNNNPDGYGITYTKGGDPDGKLRVLRSKNKPDAESLHRMMTETLNDSHVLLHLRWNTSGETELRNAHPFPVLEFSEADCDVRMAHNGHIQKYHTKREGKESDTRQFVRSFVRPLFDRMSAGWHTHAILDDPFIQSILEDECGSGSVLVFLSGDGDSLICNEKRGWFNESGVFFSNKYSFNQSHRDVDTSTYVSRYFDDHDNWYKPSKSSKSTTVGPYSGPKQTKTTTPVHDFKVGDLVRHKHVSNLAGKITAVDGQYSSFVTVVWGDQQTKANPHFVRIHCDSIEADVKFEEEKALDMTDKKDYTADVEEAKEIISLMEADDLVTISEGDFEQLMDKPEVAKALFSRMQDVIRDYMWDNNSYLTKGA